MAYRGIRLPRRRGDKGLWHAGDLSKDIWRRPLYRRGTASGGLGCPSSYRAARAPLFSPPSSQNARVTSSYVPAGALLAPPRILHTTYHTLPAPQTNTGVKRRTVRCHDTFAPLPPYDALHHPAYHHADSLSTCRLRTFAVAV